MLYILTEKQHNEIAAAMPEYLVFSYQDENGEYIHDSAIRPLWNFDLDGMLTTLYGKDYSIFLASIPRVQYLEIYNHLQVNFETTDRTVSPKDQPYNILGLYKDETIVDGDLIQVIYYATLKEDGSLEKPVVRENRTYVYENEHYKSRQIDITWYYQDGSDCLDTKTTIKLFTPAKAMQAIERKRANILASVKLNLIGYIMMDGTDYTTARTMAIPLLSKYGDEVSVYASGYSDPLINALQNESATEYNWLDDTVTQLEDKTIRELVIYELDFMGRL